ncbi:MAG: hypothetical protein V2A67_06905 [Bacteroidota bacterium]
MKLKLSAILLMVCLISMGGMAQPSAREKQLVRARFQISGQQYKEALSVLDAGQPSTALVPKWSLAKAYALKGIGRLNDAAILFAELIELFPAEANYQLCLISIQQNDTENALEYLRAHLESKDHFPEKIIKLDPSFIGLENDRTWISLWQENWYTQSEQAIGEADYLISSGKFDEALLSIENIPANDYYYTFASFLKGKALRGLNQDRMAMKAFEEALSGSRLNERTMAEALDYFINENLTDLAATTVNKLYATDPTNPDYCISKALIQLGKGSGSSVVAEMDELEEMGIGSSELHYRAGLKVQDKYPDRAIAYFTKAIDSGIMDARYYYSRGILKCSHTQVESGLDDLAMSLDINPNQPELYVERGELRRALGDLDGACHDWQKALQMGNSKAADLIYKYCR